MKFKKLLMVFCVATLFHVSHPMESDVGKDIAIGSAAGVTEVVIDQPLTYLKNMVQQDKISMKPKAFWQNMRLFLRNPRILWRGTGVNAASLAPVTAIQVAGYNAILKQLNRNNEQQSGAEKMAAAYMAGVLSGMVSCPSENVMLHQQNSGTPFLSTTGTMVRTYGMHGLYRGLAPSMHRDGGFAAGYLGLRPIIRKQMQKHTSDKKVLTLAPGIIAGLAASLVTHPFDTVKTKMQAELNKKELASMLKVFAKVWRNESIKGLYKGLGWRSFRVVNAINIMGYVTDKLSAMLKDK